MNGNPARPCFTAAAVLAALLCTPPGAAGSAAAQLSLPTVQPPLGGPLDREIDRTRDRAESRLDRRPREAEQNVVEPARETAEVATQDVPRAVAGSVANGVTSVTGGLPLRPFLAASDPQGWPIEKDRLVMLLDADEIGELRRQGYSVVSRRDLRSLGLVLATLQHPRGGTLPQALRNLRERYPASRVDYNHLYHFTSDRSGDAGGREATPSAAGALRIGLIDSAVAAGHPSLGNAKVVAVDFAGHEGSRPRGHGTAVASILAKSAGGGVEILSASVFFQLPGHAPGATTEALVAALDWLALEGVPVVNMSLAGPANALLERALTALADEGPVVVAAVGNNGPSGKPLYPAAYEGVIGVTAVDRERRIYRYSNRGAHVDYAALGVNVKVADSAGSWRMESGTSMAAPRVAAIVAALLRNADIDRPALQAALLQRAEDLGKTGFDRVYGHGLLQEPAAVASR